MVASVKTIDFTELVKVALCIAWKFLWKRCWVEFAKKMLDNETEDPIFIKRIIIFDQTLVYE